MLSVNKTFMDQKLSALYDNAFKKAAYEAYLKASGHDDVDSEIASMELQNKPNPNEIKDKMKSCANAFADEFVKQLKNAKLLETISDEIDGHVKSLDFMILEPSPNPTTGTTLANAGGPVAGTISINTTTGSTLTIF